MTFIYGTTGMQEILCFIWNEPIRFEPRTFLRLARKAVLSAQTHSCVSEAGLRDYLGRSNLLSSLGMR